MVPNEQAVGELMLTWQDGDMQGSTVHHYTIEVWTKVDGAWQLAETKTTSETQELFEKIIGSKEYKFRVATDAEETGKSAFSTDYEYTAPPGKPSKPQSFNKQASD